MVCHAVGEPVADRICSGLLPVGDPGQAGIEKDGATGAVVGGDIYSESGGGGG